MNPINLSIQDRPLPWASVRGVARVRLLLPLACLGGVG